jgi:glycosyltransferase involved in cell wall biosynthesis
MSYRSLLNTFSVIFRIKSDWYSYHLRKAEHFGIFESRWYRSINKEIDFSEIEPFQHYLSYGWKQGLAPSMGFDEAKYCIIAPDFRTGYKCPVIDAIQRVNKGLIKRRDLKKLVTEESHFPHDGPSLLDGISVSGYLKSEIGLGQSARNLIDALDGDGVPTSLHDFPLKGRDSDKKYVDRIQEVRDRRSNLHILPIAELPPRKYEIRKGVYNILYPYWELPSIPRYLCDYVSRYDEIWAPSTYIAEMFAALGAKVTIVRQPLPIPLLTSTSGRDRSSLKFLTYYDFDSSIVRKNIKAPIIAFQKAFPNQRDVTLTVKARGSEGKGAREWLAHQAALDPRIRVIDETISRDDIDRLMMDCDAFISLHRSEGFGFGAAEALAAGKAVVSTDYSATTDFITTETGYPVQYDLIAVKKGEYPYWEDQVWADPRIDSAVGALQEIYTDRVGARTKGSKGREMMERLYSPAAVGAQIKILLHERGLI